MFTLEDVKKLNLTDEQIVQAVRMGMLSMPTGKIEPKKPETKNSAKNKSSKVIVDISQDGEKVDKKVATALTKLLKVNDIKAVRKRNTVSYEIKESDKTQFIELWKEARQGIVNKPKKTAKAKTAVTIGTTKDVDTAKLADNDKKRRNASRKNHDTTMIKLGFPSLRQGKELGISDGKKWQCSKVLSLMASLTAVLASGKNCDVSIFFDNDALPMKRMEEGERDRKVKGYIRTAVKHAIGLKKYDRGFSQSVKSGCYFQNDGRRIFINYTAKTVEWVD